jgi:hypothetical protein
MRSNDRVQRRHVQQLLQEALVVTARPAVHDALHFDIFSRERFESQSRHRRRVGVDVQGRAVDGGAQQQGVQFKIVLDVGSCLPFLTL